MAVFWGLGGEIIIPRQVNALPVKKKIKNVKCILRKSYFHQIQPINGDVLTSCERRKTTRAASKVWNIARAEQN